MEAFPFVLIASTLLVGLVAGFVFAFAAVIMPGIGEFGDREFLQAFKAMDRVIQNNQPAFIAVWVGSVLTLAAASVLGFAQLEGLDRGLLIGALVIFAGGVQIPTATVNVPLNNELQRADLQSMGAEELAAARQRFEPRWNRWNVIRTVLSIVTSGLLLTLLLRL